MRGSFSPSCARSLILEEVNVHPVPPLIADAVARLFRVDGQTHSEVGGPLSRVHLSDNHGQHPTHHGPVTAAVYHPQTQAGDSSAAAVYVNVHGGGFVVSHPEQDDPWCRYLATHAGVAVISPDYVLAPRYRFPAALEQIYDVVRWAADPRQDWGQHEVCVPVAERGGNLSAARPASPWSTVVGDFAARSTALRPLNLVTPTGDKPSTVGSRARS